MAEKTRSQPFQVLEKPAFSDSEPPRTLGQPGRNLWNRITAAYDINDAGGRELLALACQALDRAESLRKQIDADGEIIRARNGPRDHPALKHELANRSFVAKTLQKLGLDVETAVRPGPGRPPSAFVGITDPEPYR